VVDGVKAASTDATTTFVTDANVVATTVPRPMYAPRNLYMSSTDNYMQEIKTFLEKPQLVVSGFFTNTDTASSFTQFTFPGFYGTKPIWTEKVRGYFGIRMDLSFRLVVNATRFQQGRYMLLWKPAGGADPSNAKTAALIAGHVMTLAQRSQMPHAEIDINCDTEIQFDIPFSNQFNFCHVRTITAGNSYNSLGSIQIYPYSALSAVAGSLSCGYTLYVSAKNVELIAAATPQSGRFNVTRRGKNETEKEQESANMGPISSVMSRISKASSILTGVPVLSSYASSASWIADIVGKTANVFGYSRPVNLEHANRMTKDIFPYFANTDGPDNSYPMGLSYKNELASMNGISPTDLDEMDFSFLVTIPSYIKTVKWETNATHPAGTLLDSFPVSPNGISFPSTTVNTALLLHLAPCQFVSRLFQYWRGTMVYKFKIVKTEFHSGRLSFSFNPQTSLQALSTVQSFADLPYIHRDIIDIRIDNEVIFKVPFVSDTPWKEGITTDDADTTGIFAIHVIDPLVAPDTVSQSVSILVEISMGPDAEFAVPSATDITTPFYGAAPQMGNFDNASLPEPNNCNEVNTTVGAMTTLDDTTVNSSLCIGEKISSLRRLMRKPSPFVFTGSTPTQSGITVWPFHVTGMTQNGAANVNPTVASDLYGLLSSLYLYSRGSVRLKYVNANPIESSIGYSSGGIAPLVPLYFSPKYVYLLLNATSGFGSPINYFTPASPFNAATMTTSMVITAGKENQEIQVPHYHRLPLRNNFEHFGNTQYFYTPHSGVFTGNATTVHINRYPVNFSATTAADAIPTRVFRATADDCTLSYFLSIPPLTPVAAAV
jgi:hypothetical protein